jgi:hypothetical protein
MALFGEQASRVVVSCVPGDRRAIQELAARQAIKSEFLGRTGREKLVVQQGPNDVISVYISDIKNVWAQALESALHSDLPERIVPDLLDK